MCIFLLSTPCLFLEISFSSYQLGISEFCWVCFSSLWARMALTVGSQFSIHKENMAVWSKILGLFSRKFFLCPINPKYEWKSDLPHRTTSTWSCQASCIEERLKNKYYFGTVGFPFVHFMKSTVLLKSKLLVASHFMRYANCVARYTIHVARYAIRIAQDS